MHVQQLLLPQIYFFGMSWNIFYGNQAGISPTWEEKQQKFTRTGIKYLFQISACEVHVLLLAQ